MAEEVQRLAERSGDATRQIAAIVRTIQTDTQDAVAAMERSTQGVVEGARLSDAAGTALADIDRVTRELSELIARISAEALREAQSANVVAANIQHIFAVTEQTSEGTRSTSQDGARTVAHGRGAEGLGGTLQDRLNVRRPMHDTMDTVDAGRRRRPERPGLGPRRVAPFAGDRRTRRCGVTSRSPRRLSGSDVDAVDPAVLRSARSHLHQGVGALELVGLPAVADVLRASEAAVQRLAARPALVDAAAVETVERVSFALLDFLGRQLAGKPVSPVMLFPQYRAAQQLAGADRIHPADLWKIDWQWLRAAARCLGAAAPCRRRGPRQHGNVGARADARPQPRRAGAA